MRQWDDSQPFFIESRDFEMQHIIGHQGLRVPVGYWEAAKEEHIHRYFPPYYVASDEGKRRMLAKALWTRLQTLGFTEEQRAK